MARKVPSSGINRFRSVLRLVREHEARHHRPCLDLSMGNPDGVPPPEVLALQSRLAGDPRRVLHTYAEDDDLAGFAGRMVELHTGIRLHEHEHLAVLPIPGIKTASALLPLACGLHRSPERLRLVTHVPAYDVVQTWGSAFLSGEHLAWPLRLEGQMRLDVDELERALSRAGLDRADLVLVIRPGNPAAVGATRPQWERLIAHCVARGTRLVNDAAYGGLADHRHVPLASVAAGHPELEWMELYSVSKSFSDPGARLGALVGSRDFVADFELIKGHTDSGPVPFVMAAYGEYLERPERARAAMDALRSRYAKRVGYLVDRLTGAGLRSACPTEAGFFTLWRVPRRVLDTDLASAASSLGVGVSEAFNRVVAQATGIVGVHFDGVGPEPSPLVRYAVCADVLDPAFRERFESQLPRLQPAYD